MNYVTLNVEIYASTFQQVTIVAGTQAHKLFLKWQESGEESDFEEFADWIRDDVAESMEFEIENVEEV